MGEKTILLNKYIWINKRLRLKNILVNIENRSPRPEDHTGVKRKKLDWEPHNKGNILSILCEDREHFKKQY